MELNDILSHVEIVGIPTRTNFRGVTIREIALLNHKERWGEFSPFSDYSEERDALWLQAAIESLTAPAPASKRGHVRINATLPEVPIEQVGEVLSWFPGCTTVKIKVGTANDLERIAEVFRIIPDARLRLDANGLFSIQEAESFVTGLYNKYGHHLEYIEQPCASLAENGALRIPIPIAIDENLRLGGDISAISEVAGVVIIKVAPLGGISRSLEIIEHLDKPVVISSALESSVGISAGLALAASLADDITCGLGTVALLSGDVSRSPLLPMDGRIEIRDVSIDQEALAQYRLSEERVQWWHNRIEVAFKRLQSHTDNPGRGE